MIPKWVTIHIERPRAKRLANYLIELTEPGHTILDCGCGTMYVANLIHQASGARIIGSDILNFNESELEMCVCPGENLPFADSSVDVVLLIFVLHHSRDPISILRESIRVARKRVIIFEDVYENRLELGFLKIFDWLGNRTVSASIPLPFTFKPEAEWKRIFHDLDAKLVSANPIRPLFFLPTRHRGFVVDVE